MNEKIFVAKCWYAGTPLKHVVKRAAIRNISQDLVISEYRKLYRDKEYHKSLLDIRKYRHLGMWMVRNAEAVEISTGLWYSKTTGRYFTKELGGMDETRAAHHEVIGNGALLKDILKNGEGSI